ncbi:MAG: CHASE2 domain-containing protein, partial [Phycisphaerales bacterium]|nr:CHASE2 domain-containing protein [Phycisphaerales bacterium]
MTAPRKGKPLSFLAGSSRVARMTRIQWMLGVVVTIIVTLLAVTGNLRSIEQPPFDWRSGLFAKNAPSPSNDLVLVALDDQTIRLIDLPPPRLRIAQAIDELNRAGAKTIAIDIIFDQERAEGADNGAIGNAALQRAIRDHGSVVLATQFEWLATHQDQERGLRVPFQLVYQSLRKNPDLTLPQLVDQCASTPDLPEDIRAELRKD